MKIFFLYSSSVYSRHVLVSCASANSISFLSFIVLIFAWNVPLVSNFLEEISSLSHSIISLYFFPLITEEGFLISPCYSSHSDGYIFPFLLCLSLLFFSQLICKASSDSHFAFLHLSFLGMVLITDSCTMLETFIHSSSGTLSDLIPWVYLSLPLNNHKWFDLGHAWMV